MRDAARRAIEIARPLARGDLEPDGVETLALVRLLEVLGEAVRRVPESIRSAHPTIPWRQIAGTRDRLIHGYDRVDPDVLWTIVRDQLPPLVGQIEDVLEDLERSDG